jgi:hypothetical protein
MYTKHAHAWMGLHHQENVHVLSLNSPMQSFAEVLPGLLVPAVQLVHVVLPTPAL